MTSLEMFYHAYRAQGYAPRLAMFMAQTKQHCVELEIAIALAKDGICSPDSSGSL